jgi:hypothetical protein
MYIDCASAVSCLFSLLYVGVHLLSCAGIYHKVPWSQQEWNEWALTPADDGTLHYMFELGKADAAAWAKQAGDTAQQQQQQPHDSGSKGRKLAAGSPRS